MLGLLKQSVIGMVVIFDYKEDVGQVHWSVIGKGVGMDYNLLLKNPRELANNDIMP